MYLVDKGDYVYVGIHKGLYGLNQAAQIDFYHIVKLMKPHEYIPLRSNPGIWFHETLPTKFAVCVDNFGIKYTNTDHDHHLVDTIRKYYTISID